MTHEEFFGLHKSYCERMLVISKAKQADYTGESLDAFANFRLVELMGITSTEVGILTRISDKMARIASFLQKGSYQVADEKVEDTLLDACNYLLLLAAYLHEKNQETKLRNA